MSQTVQSMSLSKEMTSEESYSKTSVSSSSKMLSSRMESQESISSTMLMDSNLDSLLKGSDTTSLVAKMESDLSLRDLAQGSITGTKMSSLEKSSSIQESEDSISYKKSEVASSLEVQESSKSMSVQSTKEEMSMKSSEISSEKVMKSELSSVSVSSDVSEEKVLPVFVVIMDYSPREGDPEGLKVMEGQEVEVVDSSRAHKWRVRLRKTTTEGMVPSCYMEKKDHVTPPTSPPLDAKTQAVIARREKVLKELVESEEDFARDMQYVVNNYIKEMESKQMPKELRDYKDTVFTNFKAISEFHNNVLMKGIQYYVNEPSRLGKTFLRLERDFDMHVAYCRDEPEAEQLLVSGPLKDYFDAFSQKLQDEKSLSEHLKLPIQRINDYQLLLKELIKHTARLKEETLDLEKAHDFMQAIPQRIADLQYLNSIQGYRGNLHKLGRILKHDWFDVTDGNNLRRERFLFLFKGRIFITDHKRVGATRSMFIVKYIIKLPEVEIVDNADDDELKLRFQHMKKGQAGYPFTLKAKTMEQKEEWLKVIQVTAIPQGIDDLGDDELDLLPDETEVKIKTKVEEDMEKIEAKVEVLEDFEAYEEMHTVITESMRSGSLTSLDDFHSALEDETSLCFTASDMDSGHPGRPRFIKPLRARSCAEGTEAILECEVCASPDATVAWLKDNAPLQASQRTSIESDGGKHRLILKTTDASDAGLYTIIASNLHGTVSSSAPFAVHSAPEMPPPSTPGGSPLSYGPIFLEKLRDMELQEGTAFRVCVIVQGEPAPIVTFYKEDQEIQSEGRIRSFKENKECYELIIDNVTAQDSGKYSCVAVSGAGQNVTSCNFTVTKPRTYFKIPDDDLEKLSTPDILEHDQAWLKDGAMKEPEWSEGVGKESSERFKVSIDEAEDTVSLVFQHVTPDDAGMYTCVASTSGGKISCSAELTVQGGLPREPEAPKTTASATEVEAKAGGSALLELTATGFPKPKVSWTKDGQELKPGDKYAVLLEDEETYTMAIKNVSPEDSGDYLATAKNELGEAEVAYHLTVTSPPKFSKPMKDMNVLMNEDIKFQVGVQGSPEPTITWCKDGQQLKEGGRIKMEEEGDERRLVIEKAKKDDSGNYSCTIKNKNGSQAGFGALQVDAPPKFIQGLKDTSAAQGQDASFSVKISGNPKPDLKWSKGGSELKIDRSHVIQKEESSESYSLTIKKTSSTDSGKYSCEISNCHGKDTTSGSLTVKEKPTFSQKLKDKTVKEGEKNVDLTVKVSGAPSPTIKWYIDDIVITESSKYKLIAEEDTGTFTLRMKEVTSDVAGKYKCVATNEAGGNETVAEVKVEEETKTKTTPPEFVKGLKDTKVTEGEAAKFNVKISGTPTPSVKWAKDGAELKIDEKHTEFKVEEDGASLTLIIHEATKDDSGKYSCTITNTSGSETTSSKLTVTESEKQPSFRQGLEDQIVKEEETVKFSVKFDGKPKPTAKWTKDAAELTIDKKRLELKTEEAEDSLTLIIHKATKEDSGKYSCTITNTSGSEKTSSKLTVTESEKAPSFRQGLKDQTVKEEETVKFSVKFDGKPKPTAKWTKDGAELTIDKKRLELKTEEAEDSLTLIIHKATKEDSGKYSCTITNTSGSKTTDSKLTVSASEKAPSFSQGLKDQSVKEEETVQFKVKFDGKPKPTAKWDKDGADLTIDGKTVELKTEEADNSLTLIIRKTTKNDGGKYTCTIKNSSGSETTSSKLTVTELTETAKFVKGLNDQSVKEEETVKLTVKISGKPKPTAKWTKDGAELKIDNKHFEYKIEEAEDSLTLIIHQVTKEDGGDYSCAISNTSGSDTTSSKLTVKELEKAPKFLQGLKDQTVKEEQTVHFTVKFDGKPKPIAKWNKDGAELSIDGQHVELKYEEAEDSLTIILHQSTKDDAGKYTCTITNTSGSETTSSKLIVSDSVSSPTFIEGLKDRVVKEGETIKMTVKFSGKPKPSAKWRVDGSELTIDGTHVELKTEDTENSLTLVIHDATKEDAGKYTCIITNSAGTQTSSGKLTVSSPPVFVKGLKDVEGEENGTVRLNVKFEGQPEPVATWKKDSIALSIDGKHLKTSIESDDSLTLVITKVTKEDVGQYTCELKNPHGSATTSGKLVVTGKPVIKRPLEDKEVLEGESDLELVVEVKATPAPDIKWFLDDKEINNSDFYKLVNDESKGIYKLVVKKTISDTQGRYRFEATNAGGKADTAAKLTLLEKPKFLKDFTDILLLENETIQLETSVSGSPAPTITWFKGKKDLTSNERCQKISEGKKHSLTIQNATLEDTGAYSCKAKNSVGEASQTAKVTVKSKKDTQGPAFLTHLYDQVIVVGDAGRMEVKITGKPQPNVTWYRNEDELKQGEEVLIKNEEQTYTLTLKNLKVKDSATYTCKAENEHGEASESAVLTVKEPVAPKIDGLEDLEVSYGSPARLKAKISGFPIPEVKWLKDGVPIKTKDETYQITEESESNKHAVSVKSVKESQVGEFICVASNAAGQDDSKCKLTVKALAPVFTKEMKDQSVDVNDPFKFQVEVYGYPYPTITWYKGTVVLENDGHFVSTRSGDVNTMAVGKADAKDGGIFSCKATNEAGEATSKATLKIEDFAPKFTEKLPNSIKLIEGDQLHLKAKVCGQPIPEIKWYKDGKPLKPSNKIKISVSPDGTAELIIDDVTHDDSGTYKMAATNDLGQATSESDVTVEFRPKNTKPFVQQLHSLDIVTGSPVTLEAKVAGNPKPTITWLKDGQPITGTTSGAHAIISVTPEGKAVLAIDHANLEDAGEYKLTVANELGEDSSSAEVKVSVPGKKPSILKELKSAKFMEGETGKLEAIVAGHPQPNVTWMHNGKNVIEGKHCSATLDPNGLASLSFPKVAKEDGGQYTVVATNKLGKAISEAPVIVVPVTKKEEEKKPKKLFEFIQGLMPVLVPEGRPCKLEAQVTTDPKAVSVKWMKDGKELSRSERMEMSEDGTGCLKLCIKQMSPEDRGKYAVIASDGQGEIKSEALVNMMPAMPGMSGNKPYFEKGLDPVTLPEGETLKLQAVLSPDAKCVIRWMKDCEDIDKSDRIKMSEHPDGTIALTVEAATPEDSGKYVVIASNDEGKTRSSAMVAVIGQGFRLPSLVDVLKPCEFVAGQPAKLEAKVDGEPRPQVTWFREGEPLTPSDRLKMIEGPDGKVALEIKEAIPEDAGKYTLVIANVGGETRCSAPVKVNQPPVFGTPLQDVVGVEGYPGKLECKVTGDPLPEVKWLKDGSEVSPDDNHIRQIRLPDGGATLVFDKVTPDDGGRYKCLAKNPYGEKPSECGFKVIGKEAEGQPKTEPTFVTPLSDVTVPEGDNFKLEAIVSGNPLPNPIWLLDGQPLSSSDHIIPAFDGKKVSLTVNRCNPQHAGEYECRLSNILGDVSSKGKVSVLGNKAPKFIERLSDTKFSTNEPMKLICRVEGIPDPDIEWYLDGSRIYPGLKYTTTRESDKCILVLPKPRANDSGVYECRAKNKVGKDTCKATISVSGADVEGEPAMFLKKLRDTGVLTGMTAKMTACITGVPKPDIKWFKDGEQISSDSRRTLEADPNGVIRLLIRGVNKSDIGSYRVSISNMFGSQTCTAKLDIESRDAIISEQPISKTVDKVVKAGPPAPLPHAPYIFKMCDTSASLGWRPSVPQYPQVPFTYRLEMCRIPDGEWSTYKSGIKDSSCDVRDLVPGLDYRFRIRVENKYGASEPSPYVTAHRTKLLPPTPGEHKPRDFEIEHEPLDKYAAAPRFLRQEEESIYAVRGHPARVEFWVYGCPQPKLTWFFNNVPVETSKYDYLEDRNGQVILFITRMGDNDVGYYTCKAVNEHGEAQQKIKVMIAEAPVFSKRLDPQTVMIRQGGNFVCKVDGVPPPKIKWFKDWHPLSESSRIQIRFDTPGTCTLTLSSSILKDCGLYTCTATNVAGSATTSAMLTVEECENEYHILTYRKPNFVKPSERPFEDHYVIGDELGRGTQGITYHAVDRKSGKSYAAKAMHGTGKLMDFMTAEMDLMNQLCHPRLVRLWNAHQTKSSLTLATDICGGGELLSHILQHGRLTESLVAQYIKQTLEGLQHMHEKNIAHLGLTIGDLLVTRLNSDSIKIGDFGLATRLYSGRDYIQEYGHPEFVAPEVANKQPVSLAADMWTVGIISYLLLTGDSPFLRENDRETLKEVQKGKVNFYHDGFVVLSDEARDFLTNLLTVDPSQRMDVTSALKHKWLDIASVPDRCDELGCIEGLKEYYKKWKSWYQNASCRRYYRRRTLESCFTHPSRMIYPPTEEYTPPSTPDRELNRTRVKPAAFDDVTFQQRIEREPIDVRSESHYQNGPDTFLLPLRDPDFPARIRRYLKVGASRSPILARHLKDKHWGYSDVAVKERRKFMDVMDEEIDDEKRGVSRSAPMRLRHEVGTVGSGYDHIDVRCQKKKRGFRVPPGAAPYFREKVQDAVVREGEEAVFQCCVASEPPAQFSWFRNDGILIESSRIEMKKWSDGRCTLTLKPAKAYDVGVYKCSARNSHGTSACRARLSIGSVPGKLDPPKTADCSATEVYLTWMPPKFEGHCPTLGYALEYKEASEESWTKVASNVSHEFFLVRNLKPEATYNFRISAVNKFGWGEFSSPSEPTLTLVEPAPKIQLNRSQKYQQDLTEGGQALILDDDEHVKLEYGVEEDPLEMQEGQPTELYNFISEIARGRFSVVVKVWDKKVNAAFVAKACHMTEATAEDVKTEFEIYKSLQHERIAVLHSASCSGNSMFLVMEKLSGIDVLTYLSSRRLYTEETVSKIIHQVVDALEYLHFRNICYFELQPDNVVMVDRHNPFIKLVDFGSAQYVPEEGSKVLVKGCIEYLAPEVLKGEDVHTSVDIWGVGVLTYILLSGVSPFVGDTDRETIDNVLYVRYHFDHLYKEVSQEATHFLMQLFKRTPQKRPTAEECLENKWLLPNEFMMKKREHAIFMSHNLHEFSEQFHSLKGKSTPASLLNIFGKSLSRSESLDTNTTE